MSQPTPVDHERDRELGNALREALTPPDEDAFVRRVIAHMNTPTTWWDVLGGWSRPGVAAALVLAAVAGFWMGRALNTREPAVALEDVLSDSAGNGTMTVLLASPAPPAVDVLFASTNGN